MSIESCHPICTEAEFWCVRFSDGEPGLFGGMRKDGASLCIYAYEYVADAFAESMVDMSIPCTVEKLSWDAARSLALQFGCKGVHCIGHPGESWWWPL